MHTTGAGTKTATIILFIFMICSLCNSILLFIAAGIGTKTANAGKHQQVNTEYEHDRFHGTKIMVLEKTCCSG